MDSKDLDFTSPTPSEIISNIEKELATPPKEVAINLILTGNGAKRYHFIKSILSSSYPELDNEEIDKYLLRSGVERELERIAHIWNQNE
jgi:hypothetical protein